MKDLEYQTIRSRNNLDIMIRDIRTSFITMQDDIPEIADSVDYIKLKLRPLCETGRLQRFNESLNSIINTSGKMNEVVGVIEHNNEALHHFSAIKTLNAKLSGVGIVQDDETIDPYSMIV